MDNIKIAILDLYEGAANQGMRCIREIVNNFAETCEANVIWDEFEVRKNLELPDLSYDIYISSGGPGSPFETKELEWDIKYMQWLENIFKYNNNTLTENKKYVFFICHSFQLACRYLNIGNVCKRKSTSFGVFPTHMMKDGYEEEIFNELNNPFYAVDSRDYQVIEPNYEKIVELGCKILAIEKERPHIPLERALMAIRFNEYMIGTQFHPEADPTGMSTHLQTEDKKKTVVDNYGIEKWQSMIDQLVDPDKIKWTHDRILPNFLNQSVQKLIGELV